MCRSRIVAIPAVFLSAVCAAAGTIGQDDLDPSTLPSAFAGTHETGDSALRRRLPTDMSVVVSERFIVAAPGPAQETTVTSRRMDAYDANIRRRLFADLEVRRIVVVLAGDVSTLRYLAKALYPGVDAARIAASGFYHPTDRLILSVTSDGDRAFLHGLMRALVKDDNPSAPQWYIEAMATLYESHEESRDRLRPTVDERMALIPPDEDLDYDVFAGICDCSPLTAEQHALIRLLLIYLDERGRLAEFRAAVRQQGQYTTLLQALDTMGLDRRAWKSFAERRVNTYWKAHGKTSLHREHDLTGRPAADRRVDARSPSPVKL